MPSITMNTTGFVGKLPQRGDFVSGRLPATFSTPWNDWSEQLVTVCRELQPVGTDDLWYRLPIYRFLLSSGIAGDNAWIGVTLPSADSVGRLFPFCLARNIDPAWPACDALREHETYYTQLEQLLVDLFSAQLDFEQLPQALSDLDANSIAPTPPASTLDRQSIDAALSIRLSQTDDTWDQAAGAILASCCSAYSIWSTSPLSRSAAETLFCEALPSAATCASLFSGDFSTGLWSHDSADVDERQPHDLVNPSTTQAMPHMLPFDEDDGDTKPVFLKPPPVITPTPPDRQADILELDDNQPNDAPWDS